MQTSRLLPLFIVLLITFCTRTTAKSFRKRKHSDPRARNAKFLNKSGAKIDFFWINPHTRELAHSHTEGKGVVWGGETGINTYVGHEFEVIELEVSNGKCLMSECRRTTFQVNENEDQVYILNENFKVEIEDNKSRSMKKAREALDACKRNETLASIDEQIQQLADCMEKEVQRALNETSDEIAFQAGLRRDMGSALVQYACDDPNTTTTEPFRNESWTYTNPISRENEEYDVQVLFETELTKIKHIPGALTPEQCQILLDLSIIDTSSTDNPPRVVLPHSARTEMPVLQVLMKLQNLYKSFLGMPVTFSSDPLLVWESYGAVAGECAAAQECGGTTQENASSSPTTFLERNLIPPPNSSDDSTENAAAAGQTNNNNNKEPPPMIHTSLLILCETAVGSGLHFARTGTHIAPNTPGDILLLIHRESEERVDKEGYLDDMAICRPIQGEFVFALHQVRLEEA